MKKIIFLLISVCLSTIISAQWSLSYTLCDSWDSKAEWYLTDSIHYYNTGLLPDSTINFFSNDLGESWDPMQRLVFTYDGNGNMLTSIFSYMGEEEWVLGSKSNFTYNNNGQLLEFIDQYYSNGEWIDYLRVVYTYDEENLLIMETTYTWNEDAWDPNYKIEYVNGVDGPASSSMYYYYEGDWLPDATSTYTYADGLLVLHELFDSFGEDLNYTEYTYDDQENITMLVIWDWLSSYNAWFNTDITRTYDANGNLVTEEMGHLEYQSGNTIYLNDYLCHYSSTFVDVNVAELPTAKPYIFPNPASSTMNVLVPIATAITIYDAKGSLVMNLNVNPGKNNIDVSGLESGIYNVIFENGYNTTTERVVIR